MTNVRFSCPHCKQRLSIEAQHAGSQVPCPRCGAQITVPLETVDAKPFHDAIRAGQIEQVTALLQAHPELINSEHTGSLPLNTALNLETGATQEHLTIAELLIACGARCDAFNREGYAPLHLNAFAGDVAIAELLLVKGAQVDVRNPNDGATPLHLAAMRGKADLVEFLLSQGADVNAQGKYGMTALHLAAVSGHVAVLGVLVSKGADASVQDYRGRTALQLAEEHRRQESVKALGGQPAPRPKSSLHRGSKTPVEFEKIAVVLKKALLGEELSPEDRTLVSQEFARNYGEDTTLGEFYRAMAEPAATPGADETPPPAPERAQPPKPATVSPRDRDAAATAVPPSQSPAATSSGFLRRALKHVFRGSRYATPMSVFVSKQSGIALRYPQDWQIVCENEQADDWVITGWAGPEHEDGRAGFLIRVKSMAVLDRGEYVGPRRTTMGSRVAQNPRTPAEFIEREKAVLSFPELQHESQSVEPLAGMDAAKLVYSYAGSRGRRREIKLTLFGVGVTYQFTCGAPEARFLEYGPIFDQMIGSFALGTEPAPWPGRTGSAREGAE